MAAPTDDRLTYGEPLVQVGEFTGKRLSLIEHFGWGRCWIARDRRVYVYDGEPWILDNGAFRDWRKGVAFSHDLYRRVIYTKALPAIAASGNPPLFLVAPDIPAGGLESLELSVEAADPFRGYLPLTINRYLAVQDGMEPEDVEPYLEIDEEISSELGRPFRYFDGLFLGGTDAFKLEAARWAALAQKHGLGFHYGRCGTPTKVAQAIEVGASSIDSALPFRTQGHLNRFIGALGLEPYNLEAAA